MTSLRVRQFLTPQEYVSIWHDMQVFTNTRTEETADEIWLLEHLPVYTQGQAGRSEHLLQTGDMPLVRSDRGGQITWHGPGQLMIYTLLDNQRLDLGARDLVNFLENTLISVLGELGVVAFSRSEAPGIYITKNAQAEKIAALGLRIKKRGCYHGAALNVDCDLSSFSGIHPCGYAGQAVTRLLDCVPELPSRDEIERRIIGCIAQTLGYTAVEWVYSHE